MLGAGGRGAGPRRPRRADRKPEGPQSPAQDEIAKLDEQIKEIDKLRDQIQAVLARKQVVETLQANRSEAVHLLDQLVRQLPDGIYLKSVKQPGTKVTSPATRSRTRGSRR